MADGSANLTLPQDQNSTLAISFCNKPFFRIMFILEMIIVTYTFPANTIVIVELLRRKYKRKKDGSVSSTSSLSEVVLLNISFISICYCVYLLVVLLERLNILQVSYPFFNALCSPIFTVKPLFLVIICVDCYLAVVYPVVYMTVRNLRQRTLLFTAPVWVYALVICGIILIYHLPFYHPVCMLSFYVSLPSVMFFSISTLRTLYTTIPGSSNQTLNPVKRRAFSIILSILVVMVVDYLPQVLFFTYRFIEPTESETFFCVEYPLVALLPMLCKFAIPTIFLYSLGKLV